MSQKWPEEKLGELCKIQSGSSNTKDAVSDGQFIFFDRSKKPKRSNRYLFDCEALIIAGEGAEFRPKKVNGKFDLHQRAYAIHGFGKHLLGDYLFFYLEHVHKYFQDVAVGATVKSLRQRHFENLPVKVPSLDEQKRIVAVLDQAFAALDRAAVLIEANIHDSFDLFTNYLADTFARGGDDWSESTVGEVITLQRGFDITKKDQRPGGVPVVSSSGAKSFHNEAKAVAPGVVVGRKGSIGTVHYIQQDYWPHDTSLFVKNFKGNNPLLVFYLLKGLKLSDFDTGAANPSLNRNLVHPLPIRWPERSLQAEIASSLAMIEQKAEGIRAIYEARLTDLTNLRESILENAFSVRQ